MGDASRGAKRDSPTLVRLDRVLVSVDWDELFPSSHLRSLGSDASDHCLLLLNVRIGMSTSVCNR